MLAELKQRIVSSDDAGLSLMAEVLLGSRSTGLGTHFWKYSSTSGFNSLDSLRQWKEN